MKGRVQKWGNSLALRIPKSFAVEVGLDVNTPVEISLREGMLVLIPLARKKYTLQELLSCVTEENLHGETDTGDPVGAEVW